MRAITNQLVLAGTLFALPFAVLTSQAGAGERGWDKKSQAEVESRVMWSQEVDGNVDGLSWGPDNLVVADQWGGWRSIIDGRTGTVVWKGQGSSIVPVAGKPQPVIVEVAEDSYAVHAVVGRKEITWHKALSGIFLGSNTYPEHGLLLVLSIDKIGGETAKPRVRALSLTSGKVLWTTDLAPLRIDGEASVWSAGFVPSTAGGTLALVLNDDAYGLSLDGGKQSWRHRTEFGDGTIRADTFLTPLGDGAVVRRGCRLIRISSEKGVVWKKRLAPCWYVEGLDIDGSTIAVHFKTEDPDADDAPALGADAALALLDAASGNEHWRKAIPDIRKGINSGQTVSLTASKVFVRGEEGRTQRRMKRFVYGFGRSNGEFLFKVESGFYVVGMRTAGDNIIMFNSMPQERIEAYSTVDGSARWDHDYTSPAMAAIKSAAMSAQMVSFAGTQLTGVVMPAAPIDTQASLAVALATIAQSSAGPTNDRIYLLIAERKKAVSPAVLVVDLRTGVTRKHRLPRGPRSCMASILPNEAEGYVLEVFGGTVLCPGLPRIDAVRIPSN